MLKKIVVKSSKQFELIDISDKINNFIKGSKIIDGVCVVYTTHASAGLCISLNEENLNYDLLEFTNKLVSQKEKYSHDKIDGNARAHILSAIFGVSISLIIQNGKLILGSWQKIIFAEFDGPQPKREIFIKIIKG